MQVRVLPPQLDYKLEVIRLDEEPASKAGAGEMPVVGSSLTASASNRQRALGRSAKASAFQAEQAGSIPAGHSGTGR